MGDVHHLRTSSDSQARLLEQWITQTISQHPDTAIAERWSAMARKTARQFPGPPAPSQNEMDLTDIHFASDEDKDKAVNAVEKYIASYFDDVRAQLMAMHGELLKLQKTVAELETRDNARE